ncbi:PadR family transcriptional regulator [Arthrobacter sp.]|uniref:PadR family transcriptional regulator n=1 Tax=Arthrobacter sp. TaxID=1667 RepID=UPI003A92C4BE
MPPVFAHGAMRLYLLHLLDDGPKHGYDIIRALSDRFGGTYSPSAGSVYPRLAKLEEEGLVDTRQEGRRNLYGLTPDGRRELAERGDELSSIDADISASVTRLADTLSAEIRENMRSVRAELAATAERHGAGTRQGKRNTGAGSAGPRLDADAPREPGVGAGGSISARSLAELEHQIDDFRGQLRADLRAAARSGVDEAAHATIKAVLEQAKSSIRSVLR